MKLKELIEVLQDESIDKESEVNYDVVYNPNKNYVKFVECEQTKSELLLDDLLKSLEKLGVDTSKLNIKEVEVGNED